MGVEVNRTAMRRIVDEVINGKRLDVAEELYDAEHELHPASADVASGPEGMRAAFAGLHEEFPDVRVTIESMVAEGDTVAVRLTFRGTQTGTGRSAVWPEMVFTRFVGGLAVESWEVTDGARSWDAPPW